MARHKKRVPLVGYKIDKSDLVDFVQVRSGLRKVDATKIVDGLLEYIKEIILHGYVFTIPGLCDIGVSMTEYKPSKPCRNPRNGEPMMSNEKFPTPYLNMDVHRNMKKLLLEMCDNGKMNFESYRTEYIDDSYGD